MAVIEAQTVEEIRTTSFEMLQSIVRLYDKMYKNFVEQPTPTYDNLCGAYEELWCNYGNKVIASVEAHNKFYAYHVAIGVQNYLDLMTRETGMKKMDMMKYFDANNLE